MSHRLHIDSDFAGDPDDACALAMVLGWPDTEIVGVTTVADPDGRRAGYVRCFLAMAGRDDIPVVSGAGVSSTTRRRMGDIPDHRQFWGDLARPAARLSKDDRALELLSSSVESGASVVGIGPYTNLAQLAHTSPDLLARATVTVMGGWVYPPAPDLPSWAPGRDWNVQCDIDAARAVWAGSAATWVTLPATASATLRAADLPRLERAGRLGRLLARQSRAHAVARDYAALGSRHPGLPDDLVNFHWDPVACAVALRWTGVQLEEQPLVPHVDDGVMTLIPDDAGRRTRIVTRVDGAAFTERWFAAIEAV